MTDQKYKRDLCVDFDGVLHSYVSGWKGVAVIPDDPVPGAMPWLRGVHSHPDYRVHVYSSRSKDPAGLEAMRAWLMQYLSEKEVNSLSFPVEKPPAYLTIDDRAICFRGTFPSIQEMDCFRPWTVGLVEQREREERVQEAGRLREIYKVDDNVKQDWDYLRWDDCAIEFKQFHDYMSTFEGYEVAVLDNDGPVVKCRVHLMEWSGPVTSAINKKDVGAVVRTLVECQRVEERLGFYLREEKDNG